MPPDATPTPHRWPHRRSFTITYHDIDVLGHLNHAAYFPFMETLRCEYYLSLLDRTDPTQLDIILAEAACRFLAPARYGQEMIGEVAPTVPIGRTSFTLLYRFHDPEDRITFARGRTAVVCYDYSANAKKPIPPDRRAKLERDAVPRGADGFG